MADHPVGHPAAVAAPGNADLRLINGRIQTAYMVHELHKILKVDSSVFFPQIRKHLHLMEESISKGHPRSAVHVKDRRIFFLWVIVLWEDHPSVDIHAVGIRKACVMKLSHILIF